MRTIELPSWDDCDWKETMGTATPLHIFIRNNEPVNEDQVKQFRKELKEMLEWVLNDYEC